jgi:small subunit ribosomal protein S4
LARTNHYEGAAHPCLHGCGRGRTSTGKVVALPEREDFPKFFQEQQVVEFYAR